MPMNDTKGHSDAGALLRRLRSIAGKEVLVVGDVPSRAIACWESVATTRVVITAERRRHYLTRHPEVEADEPLLLRALVDPEQVHTNLLDPRMAIIYQRIDDDYFLRIPLWVSDRADRQNSVLSLRRVGREEVEKSRLLGRVRWEK